ncbi:MULTISPECIES: glycosyltransferase [Chryseobacterium]|jgi:glycosyltransferase involved in cell wall biosynthesis|uniref:Glycosyl transferase n=1 Tax=Chryseobacterium lathyri TaxID=395933 RepID=A0A511YDD7_9FLAO|nr:glycosyltransferase [Chryseobacterium lathyri]GEN73208.1 glycosyl transferase [Chryseobacterium lathyri]
MTSSVALCTYNGEAYIAEQLDSILNQALSVSEIIICDDGSTDNTLPILSGYAEQYPEIIKVYQNMENLGYVRNFEKAMSLCSGDIVLLCDQDDRWYDNKTEVITEIFEKHKKINTVCHNIKLFGESLDNKENLNYWDIENFNPEHFRALQEIVKRLLYQGNVFPGMSMAVRNTFLKKHLPLKRVNETIIHDYELLLLAADTNSVWIEDSVLGEYRIHPQQNIGFNKFSKFTAEEENPLTREEVFVIFKRYSFVKNAVSGLNLNTELSKEYINYCHRKYKDYLMKLSFPDRFITRIKMKYYFHIFDFLR